MINNKKYFINKLGQIEFECANFLNSDNVIKKIRELSNNLGYPIAYDIKKDELIKVNKVIKLYQIKKDDAIVTLDANEIEDVKKLTKEIV